ncbi:hypothetical protein M8C21_009646, partial [Ambrosia artemisiifolia]
MMNMSTNNKFHNNFVTNRSLYSYPSDDLLLTTVLAGGHFTGPGLLSLSHSYPPAGLGFNRQQPPLLPLPVNHQNIKIYRSNSSFNNINSNSNNNIRLSNPLNKKNVKTRGRDHSLTPKKSKNPKQNHKRDEKDCLLLLHHLAACLCLLFRSGPSSVATRRLRWQPVLMRELLIASDDFLDSD